MHDPDAEERDEVLVAQRMSELRALAPEALDSVFRLDPTVQLVKRQRDADLAFTIDPVIPVKRRLTVRECQLIALEEAARITYAANRFLMPVYVFIDEYR